MSNVLKGNFKVKNKINNEMPDDDLNSLESKFEREALKNLGGSIAFVSKKKVIWEKSESSNKQKPKKNEKTKK